MTRREKLLGGLDLARLRGFEVGALNKPLVTRAESDIWYVDHADRATLRAKYTGDPGVDVDQIVEVDAVWGERTLRESLPAGMVFDYAVASHVLEHVPDLVGWLGEIAEVLGPDGVLALPDRRFTFDYLRRESRASEAVDAYVRRNRRPAPAQIFDYVANVVEFDHKSAWAAPVDVAALRRHADAAHALEESRRAIADGAYVDVHCWVFTPDSFLTLFSELSALGLIPFRCRQFHDTDRDDMEFFVVLERCAVAAEENAAGFLAWRERMCAGRAAEATMQSLLPESPAAEIAAACAEQTGRLMELRRALDDAASAREAAEAELHRLRSSASWRLTEPLRRLRARLG